MKHFWPRCEPLRAVPTPPTASVPRSCWRTRSARPNEINVMTSTSRAARLTHVHPPLALLVRLEVARRLARQRRAHRRQSTICHSLSPACPTKSTARRAPRLPPPPTSRRSRRSPARAARGAPSSRPPRSTTSARRARAPPPSATAPPTRRGRARRRSRACGPSPPRTRPAPPPSAPSARPSSGGRGRSGRTSDGPGGSAAPQFSQAAGAVSQR